MGIPRLTRVISPFSEPVLLDGRNITPQGEIGCIQSVVIDGPSMVYHVFSRLLAWMDPSVRSPDAQPTCDERETRVSRLEHSRRRLENFQSKLKCWAPSSNRAHGRRIVDFANVLRSRNVPARYNEFPHNPFIVPAVFEDLKSRWNQASISEVVDGIFQKPLALDCANLPWADRTVMVPGEADSQCVYIANKTGSSILTNDSDLILYDLHSAGPVVFLDSINLSDCNTGTYPDMQIKAMGICPAAISSRLGVSNILFLAYHLRDNPNMGLTGLIQLSKTTYETQSNDSQYLLFAGEYIGRNSVYFPGDSVHTLPQNLDARVSELFCQCKIQHADVLDEIPHMYLPILFEDHMRRCGWWDSRLYRRLGYSAFNATLPPSDKRAYIYEYVRRGGRIVRDRISLEDDNWIAEETQAFLSRYQLVQNTIGGDTNSPFFWRVLALYELYGPGRASTFLSAGQLSQFLRFGRLGAAVGWADVHLSAQIQSVLYSLRILQQLIGISATSSGHLGCLKSVLGGLPPLHVITRSLQEITTECLSIYAVEQLLGQLFSFSETNVVTATPLPQEATHCLGENDTSAVAVNGRAGSSVDWKVPEKRHHNMYELLSQD
ncbi:XPG domain containing-domain-containing protein [Aspergillus taichungensis]|uniref:XPG domain containing-domain-containing protein n=1 Tax=Aspergillus taichungensis TaxID=482145 RepID=A0A2J5HEM9_9EURO|nr:XPG domain containing-domain-containing protein [Aspergillus taichungensis]